MIHRCLDRRELSWIAQQLLTAAMIAMLVVCRPMFAQTSYAGSGISSGAAVMGTGGAPLTYSARTDMCETGTGVTGEYGCTGAGTGHQGAVLSYLGRSTDLPPAAGSTVSGTNINGANSYVSGINTVVTDPDFGAVMIRATDYSLSNSTSYPCMNASYGVGSGGFGSSFNMGSGGDTHFWAPDSSKLILFNTGGTNNILAFNPATGTATASALCGSGIMGNGGVSFSGVNPHVIYRLNSDQENTVVGSVTSGTFLTPEALKQTGTNATAELLAVNASFVQIGSVTGTANNSGTWVGQTSGAVFTPSTSYSAPPAGSAAPYADTIYKGTLNDSGAPSAWTVTWSLLFNYNYVPGMSAPNFPTGASACLPQDYNANYQGQFNQSDDDSAFTVAFSDNGQANHTGGTCSNHSGSYSCTGPVWVANYTVGNGCRVFNSMTDQISGDYGPTGQALNGQANYIAGTISGTFTLGETLTQATTGATTALTCTQNSSGVCATTSLAQVLTGLIYGTADATHQWTGGTSGAHLTPSALPQNPTFYYPDVLHDEIQAANHAIAKISLVQQPNMKVSQVQSNTATHQTTITYTNSASYSAGQQFIFYSLAGTDDQYLNCVNANQCPIWTAANNTSSGTIVIADTVATSNYTDSENSSTALMTPNGQAAGGGFADPNDWIISGLVVEPFTNSAGHSGSGYLNVYIGKMYKAFNLLNPSTPCTTTGVPGGPTYSGPATPCPSADTLPLLPASITDDQHGSYNNHGLLDQTPVSMVTTLVCGQATSVAPFACETEYSSVWDSEIIAIENWIGRAPSGADCNYGSGATACVYRLGHTFNTNSNWNFQGQNAIGVISPDGQWLAFPSDWGMTLGCMDGTTNCWSSYTSTQQTASGSAVTWSTNSSNVVTINMPNQFCPTGGSQYYWVNSAVQSIACGTTPGQVTLSGFAESWLNNATMILGANASNAWGCDSVDSNAGNCAAFTGTVTGAPANSSGTETGTQKATPTSCGSGVPCQREDIWIAHLTTAHQ